MLLADVGEIAVMFDKRLCHARLSAAGVFGAARAPRADRRLRRAAPPHGRGPLRGRVFSQPAHGSSASGVVALHSSGGRVKAVTSADLVSGRL